MASNQIYEQCYLYANGALLAENTSVDISLDGDDQDVMTIVKGYSGQTPSPKKIMITAKSVIPITGFEFDAWQKSLDSEEVELKVQFAGTGKSITSKGFIRKPKISGGVGKTIELDFEFHGTASAFS